MSNHSCRRSSVQVSVLFVSYALCCSALYAGGSIFCTDLRVVVRSSRPSSSPAADDGMRSLSRLSGGSTSYTRVGDEMTLVTVLETTAV